MADRDTNIGHTAWFKTHSLTGMRYTVQSSLLDACPEILDSTEFADPRQAAAVERRRRKEATKHATFVGTLF